MTMRCRVSTLAISLAIAATAFGANAQDIEERQLRFALSLAADHPLSVAGEHFADLVEERSGGNMTVSVYPDAVLGSDQQNLDAVRGGTLDFTTMATGLLSGLNPEFQAFDLPFLFNSSEEAYAIADGEVASELLDSLSEDGIHGLGIWDLGFRNTTNNVRPITALEDYQGLKLRVIASPIYIDLFTQLGANAVPMTFGEVYGALESGAIDGQDNPLAVIQSSQFQEVQDYLSLTRHIYTGMPFLMSGETWDSMSEDERTIITEAAEEAKVFGRELIQEQEVTAIAELGEAMAVNELDPAEVDRLREAIAPVFEQFSAEVGESVMDGIQAELSEIRGE